MVFFSPILHPIYVHNNTDITRVVNCTCNLCKMTWPKLNSVYNVKISNLIQRIFIGEYLGACFF